ncbi:MAG: hypothetical protein LBJ69_02580 [Holosporales bacterium]|jgi:hypothetical protein|nr:hypothetical protein [Holosporales bacterium]
MHLFIENIFEHTLEELRHDKARSRACKLLDWVLCPDKLRSIMVEIMIPDMLDVSKKGENERWIKASSEHQSENGNTATDTYFPVRPRVTRLAVVTEDASGQETYLYTHLQGAYALEISGTASTKALIQDCMNMDEEDSWLMPCANVTLSPTKQSITDQLSSANVTAIEISVATGGPLAAACTLLPGYLIDPMEIRMPYEYQSIVSPKASRGSPAPGSINRVISKGAYFMEELDSGVSGVHG